MTQFKLFIQIPDTDTETYVIKGNNCCFTDCVKNNSNDNKPLTLSFNRMLPN